MNTNKLVLTTALRRRSFGQQRRQGCDDEAVAKAAIVTFSLLARMHRRCRMLNDAYEAAENKPEVRLSLQETVRGLRELHAALPARFRNKSWIATIERYDTWILEAKKGA